MALVCDQLPVILEVDTANALAAGTPVAPAALGMKPLRSRYAEWIVLPGGMDDTLKRTKMRA